MKNILVTRDNKGKVRVVEISCTWNDTLHVYVLERKTGMYQKKMTVQPVIEIKKGKAKRTITEQANLEYNSNVKKYLDKGYKSIEDFGIHDLKDFKPDEHLAAEVTDQNGNKKPMLCKIYDAQDKKTQNVKEWYASAKHDGVRAMLFKKDGIIKTSSRGGNDYNIPATYICNDEYIKSIFEKYPDIILDGEIYIHGKPLSYISGLCRQIKLVPEHKDLKFHCYDIVDESKTFKERLELINKLKLIKHDPSSLVLVTHSIVKSFDEIMKLHDYYVASGYEGLVIRDPDAKYKCGGRDRRMQKIKLFTDDEYEIVGITEGLRDEDFVFNMKTKEGYPFEAKPMGNRELKQWYRDNIDNLIGELGIVKHFGMTTTAEPVPNLPVFKYIRDKRDM